MAIAFIGKRPLFLHPRFARPPTAWAPPATSAGAYEYETAASFRCSYSLTVLTKQSSSICT